MPVDRITELLWNYLRVPVAHEGEQPSVSLAYVRADGEEPEVVQLGPDPVFAARIGELDAARVSSLPVEPAFLGGLHLLAGTVDLPHSWLDIHVGAGSLTAQAAVQGGDAGDVGVGGAVGGNHGAGSLAPSPTPATPHKALVAHGTAAPVDAEEDADTLSSRPDLPDLTDAEAQQVVKSGQNVQINEVVIDVPGTVDNAASGNLSTFGPIGELFETLSSQQFLQGFSVDSHLGGALSQTAVLQFNGLVDRDANVQAARLSMAEAGPDSVGTVTQQTTSGGNSLSNEAVLVSGSDGYDLIVVSGNYYEYNIILQFNLIIDRDLNQAFVQAVIGDGEASQQVLSSGGNLQVNEAAIVDTNSGGGLQLIGGIYSEHFIAVQSSILFDGDVNALIALLGPEGIAAAVSGQFVSSGGNVQINMARFGFEEGEGACDDVAAWLDFLANPFAGGAYAVQLVDADGKPINVLFVDGDYHDINLIVQVNIIDDSDSNVVDATASGAHNLSGDGFGAFDFDQFAGSGSNTTVNHAVIIDDNGGFGAQVVAGNYTEFNVIVQQNVLFDGDANVVTQVAGAVEQMAHDELTEALAHAPAAASGDALHTLTG
ncbi:hypothetical protein GGR16_002996 [Chelatococcus caeni]|uniref:Uncharacterized protein n=1 Tax=Chelatococcus caeni TaxID=1348468 RepID=A0A840C1V0_9HYPH|nr:hypothetical protein [Chelatococcus caeni]MBB4017962.1 hypothetical protein [Chelatococcus caeni]